MQYKSSFDFLSALFRCYKAGHTKAWPFSLLGCHTMLLVYDYQMFWENMCFHFEVQNLHSEGGGKFLRNVGADLHLHKYGYHSMSLHSHGNRTSNFEIVAFPITDVACYSD
jgi:hypothetical protein